jgi:hypothetical protein
MALGFAVSRNISAMLHPFVAIGVVLRHFLCLAQWWSNADRGQSVILGCFCVSMRFIQKPESLDITASYSPSPVRLFTLNVLASTFRNDQALFCE